LSISTNGTNEKQEHQQNCNFSHNDNFWLLIELITKLNFHVWKKHCNLLKLYKFNKKLT